MLDDANPVAAYDSAVPAIRPAVPAQPRRSPVLIAAFRPACGPRSSLIGHVDVLVPRDCITVHDIAVYQQGGHVWLRLPRDRPEARAMFLRCPPAFVDEIGARRFEQWVIFELRRQHPEAFAAGEGVR